MSLATVNATKPTAEQIAEAAREMRNAERAHDSVTSSCRLRGAVRERAVEAARQRRVNARVEGMKAENAHREACGQGPAYTDEAFGNEAGYLDSLAIEARNAS